RASCSANETSPSEVSGMSLSSHSRSKPIGPWLRPRYTSATPVVGRRRTILYDPMVSGRGSAGNIQGDPIGGRGIRPTNQGNHAPVASPGPSAAAAGGDAPHVAVGGDADGDAGQALCAAGQALCAAGQAPDQDVARMTNAVCRGAQRRSCWITNLNGSEKSAFLGPCPRL